MFDPLEITSCRLEIVDLVTSSEVMAVGKSSCGEWDCALYVTKEPYFNYITVTV